METLVPNYYYKFKCIADKCKHNCCIGWEIDIDDETMELYNMLDDEFGEKIRQNIKGEIPHFILQENDRCPFLNKNGLCDIIAKYGEDAICDICYLHPRFKNFYSSFEEMGLGLCCEEAVRIILSNEEPFCIGEYDKVTEKEKEFLNKRNVIFSVLQNRNKNIKERFEELAEKFGFEFDFSVKELCELYLSLERLDENWTSQINSLADFEFNGEIFENVKFQIFFEQLSVYLVFRHFNMDTECSKIMRFVCGSCYFVGALCMCKNTNMDCEECFDLIRLFSSETEYSETNTQILVDYFGE